MVRDKNGGLGRINRASFKLLEENEVGSEPIMQIFIVCCILKTFYFKK